VAPDGSCLASGGDDGRVALYTRQGGVEPPDGVRLHVGDTAE
jgi:hypothetical protein